jgi:methenyltetrahydromethanopterin cyclohydrolase
MRFDEIKPGMFLYRETVEGQFWSKILSKTEDAITYESYVNWIIKFEIEHRIYKTVSNKKWNDSTEPFKSYVSVKNNNFEESNFRTMIVDLFKKLIKETRG